MSSAYLMLVTTALVATGAVARAQSPLRPTTLTAEELTSVRSVVGGIPPQWAPDGSRLLIGGALGGSDLWTIPAAGGFPVSLEVKMGEIAFLQSHQPKYSPDGKWISYISNRSGPAELYVRSLVDGTERQLTRLGGRINSYSWSPDGGAIAFSGDNSATTTSGPFPFPAVRSPASPPTHDTTCFPRGRLTVVAWSMREWTTGGWTMRCSSWMREPRPHRA